jgi:hypothetical protein
MTQSPRYPRLLPAAMLLLLWAGASERPAAAAGLERFPIELSQVLPALETSNLAATGAEVRLLAHLTASAADPELEVVAIEPAGGRAARVRLVCMAREQCLAFYVAVEWPNASLAREAMVSAGVPAISIDRASGISNLPAHPIANATASAHRGNQVDTLRAGARAVLVLDGERLHIEVPVICLEAGEPGSTIRVTGLDRRLTYEALVVDSKQLKGRL